MNGLVSIHSVLIKRMMTVAEEIFDAVKDNIIEYEQEIERLKQENSCLKNTLTQTKYYSRAEALSDAQNTDAEAVLRGPLGSQIRVKMEVATVMPHEPVNQAFTITCPVSDQEPAQCPIQEPEELMKNEIDGGLQLESSITIKSELCDNQAEDSNAPVVRCDSVGDGNISMAEQDLHPQPFHNKTPDLSHKRNCLQSGKAAFICKICGKSFRFKGGLRSHMMAHQNEKRFCCDYCGWRFKSKNSLNKHERHHTEEISYEEAALDTTSMLFDTPPEDFPLSNSSSSNTPSLSVTNSSSPALDLNLWPDNFEVPWNRMPPGIKTAIALGRRPSPKDRREMVRIIVNEMRMTELNPTRSQCLTVAKMIVKEHPRSFADVLRDGTRIGTGFGSLLAQLKTRVEHVNRGCSLSRRRKHRMVSTSSPEDTDQSDQYGCVRWEPFCPPEETVESLKEKQKKMQDLYSTEGETKIDREHLSQLMEATYYLQRQSINTWPPPSIAELRTGWPYLFTPTELCNHFKLLTGISILENIEKAVEEKGRMMIQFFQRMPHSVTADAIQNIIINFENSGAASFAPCMILLLLAHFRERPEDLILQADVLATAADVERTMALPNSPRLIVLGDIPTATEWMLSIEGQVVVMSHPNFVVGLAALFSVYYVFNLMYQEEASCTLEFIQRYFVGINPPTGSKAATSKVAGRRNGKILRKKRNTVNPHVCTFLKQLVDFEWLCM